MRLLSCLLACLVGALLTSCGKRDAAAPASANTANASAPTAKSDGFVHVSVGSEPTDLDPHIVTSLSEARILPALFEPLVNFDPATLAPAPGLAERWEMSADGLTYTFHLRDARWSNGDAVTAQDVVE